jgi:4-hydroxy-4-methyl-2-oxoglutarate aldolase
MGRYPKRPWSIDAASRVQSLTVSVGTLVAPGIWDIQILARDHTMRTGKDRVALDQKNIPVSIAGVRVDPGDILPGDANGLVVVPLKRLPEVVDIAREIEAKGAKILEAVMSGQRLDDARKLYGYFSLQSRTDRK